MSMAKSAVDAEDDSWVEVSKPKKEHPVKKPVGKQSTNGNGVRGNKHSKASKNEPKSKTMPKSDGVKNHDKSLNDITHTVSNPTTTVPVIGSVAADRTPTESVNAVDATQTKPPVTVNAWAASNILTALKPSDVDNVNTVLGEAVSKLSISDRSEAIKEVFCTTCRRFDDSDQQLMTFHVRSDFVLIASLMKSNLADARTTGGW